ncbi:MAG: 4-hydroxy-3-methylbut-2-enyl diphosphate reductase [Candidatus Nanopelagicales bacterium]
MPESGRKVLLAAPRGYCAGVDRAVVTVEKALELHGAPVYVRKEIVHNRYVVDTLAARGAVFVNDTDDVPEGAVVVFSAHGVAPYVHEAAAARSLRTIDATCPLVTKVHNEARRFAGEGFRIMLIGHAGHEEVEGTMGEAPQSITIVDGPAAVADLDIAEGEDVVWLSQTTLSVDEAMQTVEALRDRVPSLVSPPSDDICYATQNRQAAVKKVAARSDLLIVVGSANSSNSVRLLEVGLQAGARAGHRIDLATEIDPAWFADVQTVGVTSGASVPEILVRDVLVRLAEFGYEDVENVEAIEERMVFALPPDLRRDLRAAGQA